MVSADWAGQVPTCFQGLPPLKLTLGESLNFSVVAVGPVRSRKSVGGLAVPPLPWRKKSDEVWEKAWRAQKRPRPTTAMIEAERLRRNSMATRSLAAW